jgi:hypothetical protein
MKWVPRAVTLVAKRKRPEADHSSSSSAHVKNGGTIPLLRRMPSWYSA